MVDPKQIQVLRKHRRQSMRALPIAIAFALIGAGILFVIDWFWPLGTWVWMLFLGIVGFGIVGDLVNIVHLNRKLREFEP